MVDIKIDWNAVVEDEFDRPANITNYRIYNKGQFIAEVGNVTTYTITDVPPETRFRISVSAVNSQGEGPRSLDSVIVSPSLPQGLPKQVEGVVPIIIGSEQTPDNGGPPPEDIIFESDLQTGVIKYVGAGDPHPGGGYISFLGGELTNFPNPGDGTQNFQQFQNTIITDEPDAQGSIPGNTYSLKTHYAGGFTDDFGLNTTIIKFPPAATNTGDNFHIRFYQKWATGWQWPGVQQKFCKIETEGGTFWTQNFKQVFGYDFLMVTHLTDSTGQFEKHAYPVIPPEQGGPGTFVEEDSINNGIGPGGTDQNKQMLEDTWYCIEFAIQTSSPNGFDGRYRIWVDDVLVFDLQNAKTRPSGAPSGLRKVELQHVYEPQAQIDQPTYMDEIVIATSKIGLAT